MTPLNVCFCKLFLNEEGTDTLHLASILFIIVDKNKAIIILIWDNMGFYGIFNHFSIKILFKVTRWSVSRILYLILKVVTINLELLLPTISSVLPCPTQSHVCQVLTGLFWTCSQRGLHYHICCQICGKLLPYHFTLTVAGGIFSVALSLGLPPPEVIRLWCSDESGLSSF